MQHIFKKQKRDKDSKCYVVYRIKQVKDSNVKQKRKCLKTG